MWLKWLPWRTVVRRFAQSQGFLDPIKVLSYARNFAQPSEVMEPIELLRAGVVFHARGLINSRAIQHNLDWIWPYWVERQFDPTDNSFIPRAFSITHINLTHRNWTAVGIPDCPELPIVDPRGLVTPLLDGWSIDAWIVGENGRVFAPSKSQSCEQTFDTRGNVFVSTHCSDQTCSLDSRVEVEMGPDGPECRIHYEGRAAEKGWLAVALRPYNPEGVSFIHRVALSEDRPGWLIEGKPSVYFSETADRRALSKYKLGDVSANLHDGDAHSIVCDVGMASAAALFALEPGTPRAVNVTIPLEKSRRHKPVRGGGAERAWQESLSGACALSVPDSRIQFLYDAAIRSLILHSPEDVIPGPYTYKRFWFRDAAFMIHALLLAGLVDRAERALDRFPARQKESGFFHSQDGEWDSNGAALWILERFRSVTGRATKPEWLATVRKGAQWILNKRTPSDGEAPHAGLLPAGFSAEHLGPNDFYYWDDFWGVAGLRSAANLLRAADDAEHPDHFEQGAQALMASIERSLALTESRIQRKAMPASPYRRMDAGAVGSLVAGYPLELFTPADPRLLGTAEFLWERCIVDGGFFQDMVHSGINPYLTLHLAQVFLRAGDPRYQDLIDTVARLATSTGQWPEAIHPATKGGCMGDGQHAWASAEWISMIRNCIVMEDIENEVLVLGAGIPPAWLTVGNHVSLGPTPTAWGPVSVSIDAEENHVEVSWDGAWHREAPSVKIRLAGSPPVRADGTQHMVRLERELVS